MAERRRRKGFWGFFASDQVTPLSAAAGVVVLVLFPSWGTFWAVLGVVVLSLAAYAWWARGHDWQVAAPATAVRRRSDEPRPRREPRLGRRHESSATVRNVRFIPTKEHSMNPKRKLALRKESLVELTNHELDLVAGGSPDSLGCIIRTVATCIDTYTVATCTCPTGPSCLCPTAGCA